MKLLGDNLFIIFHQVMFLVTGLCTTLGTQWIFYHGAATGDSYLAQLAQYIGMILVGFMIPTILKNKKKGYNKLKQEEEEDLVQMNSIDDEDGDTVVVEGEEEAGEGEAGYQEGHIPHRSVIKLAVLDLLANFCVTVGFSIVGSGMYQVIYSSVVIWCAILTFVFMKRTLSTLQWISIFGTSAGLAISSMSNFEPAASDDQQAHASVLMFGTLMTLGGTFGYSCVYVYSDYIMSQQKPAPLPARVCFYSGIYTTILSLIWIGIYTLPRYDQFVHIKKGTSTESVLFTYALITVANACHSWNYYELINSLGSVATGILQGLRAVLIYIISDAWYCDSDPAQCFTKFKGIGSIVVVGCVLMFTLGRTSIKHK